MGTKSQVTGVDRVEKDDIQGGVGGISAKKKKRFIKRREIKLSGEKAINMHEEAG